MVWKYLIQTILISMDLVCQNLFFMQKLYFIIHWAQKILSIPHKCYLGYVFYVDRKINKWSRKKVVDFSNLFHLKKKSKNWLYEKYYTQMILSSKRFNLWPFKRRKIFHKSWSSKNSNFAKHGGGKKHRIVNFKQKPWLKPNVSRTAKKSSTK